MKRNKKVAAGVLSGVVLLSIAVYLAKKNRLNWQGLCDSAADAISGLRNKFSSGNELEGVTDHGGKQLAEKARQRAEHLYSASRHN